MIQILPLESRWMMLVDGRWSVPWRWRRVTRMENGIVEELAVGQGEADDATVDNARQKVHQPATPDAVHNASETVQLPAENMEDMLQLTPLAQMQAGGIAVGQGEAGYYCRQSYAEDAPACYTGRGAH